MKMKYHYEKEKDNFGNDRTLITCTKENKYIILDILTNKVQKIIHISYSTSAENYWYINTNYKQIEYELTEEVMKEILELATDAIPEYTPQIIRMFTQLPKQEIRL